MLNIKQIIENITAEGIHTEEETREALNQIIAQALTYSDWVEAANLCSLEAATSKAKGDTQITPADIAAYLLKEAGEVTWCLSITDALRTLDIDEVLQAVAVPLNPVPEEDPEAGPMFKSERDFSDDVETALLRGLCNAPQMCDSVIYDVIDRMAGAPGFDERPYFKRLVLEGVDAIRADVLREYVYRFGFNSLVELLTGLRADYNANRR